jgi:hypothetical protein
MTPRITKQPTEPGLPRPPLKSVEPQRPGEPDAEARSQAQRLWWVIIVGLAALTAIVVWLFGQAQRVDVWSAFRQVVELPPPQFELVEARDGVVLIAMHEKDRSGVSIQLSGEIGWRNISMTDFTAKHPALSPSGTQVAYLSEQEDVHIAITSLISNTQRFVTTKVIDTALSVRQLPELSICTWSDVRWSPDETQLAFFACTQEPAKSYAVVVDLHPNPPKIVWVEDRAVVQDNRSLIWLDSDHLIISTPGLGGNNATVDTIKIP